MAEAENYRKRRGRPPGSPEQSRSHRVVTFVTELEFEQLNKLSGNGAVALSATVYQLLRDSLANSEEQN